MAETKKAAKGELKTKTQPKKAAQKKEQRKVAKQDGTITASLNAVRISPRKARLMINLIKGKQVEPALQILRFSDKKSAALVEKLLRSAISNAKERQGADVDKLWITGGWVNMGRTLKRWMPRARGSASPIKKRAAHITLQLSQR